MTEPVVGDTRGRVRNIDGDARDRVHVSRRRVEDAVVGDLRVSRSSRKRALSRSPRHDGDPVELAELQCDGSHQGRD